MPTIAEQLTQLTQDRDDLVTNLTTKGITGLTGDETFTELVPEVLNISGGGGGGNLQTKSVPIYVGGETTITPDTGYDGLSSVTVDVDVVATDYVPAGYVVQTIPYADWVENNAYYTFETSSYNVDTSKIQLGLDPACNATIAQKVIECDLSIVYVQPGGNSYIVQIRCVTKPDTAVSVAIFGIEAISQ